MHCAFVLTEREEEVCRLLRGGRDAVEIAQAMTVKPDTIYHYLVRIREKKEVPNTIALVVKLCAENGP